MTSIAKRFAWIGRHTPSPPPILIATASTADYHRLARFHYRPTHPATIARIIGAWDPTEAESDPIGVLVVSMPTLNASWRTHAWPGAYDSRDRRANARRINTDLRTISRVIVDPRYRGIGIATRLVRTYLDDPETIHTEAVAAMGAWSDFFVTAGMTPHPIPTRTADKRLANKLDTMSIQSWMLTQPTRVLNACTDHRTLDAALNTWARARGSTAKLAQLPLRDKLVHAARSIGTKRSAFTFTKG